MQAKDINIVVVNRCDKLNKLYGPEVIVDVGAISPVTFVG